MLSRVDIIVIRIQSGLPVGLIVKRAAVNGHRCDLEAAVVQHFKLDKRFTAAAIFYLDDRFPVRAFSAAPRAFLRRTVTVIQQFRYGNVRIFTQITGFYDLHGIRRGSADVHNESDNGTRDQSKHQNGDDDDKDGVGIVLFPACRT